MPVDVFPEFAPPRVEIQTPCLGLTAAEIESWSPSRWSRPSRGPRTGRAALEVGRPAVLDRAASSSGTDLMPPGSSSTSAWRPSCRRLPTWAAPPFILQPLSATSRVMKIGLSSDTISSIDMSMTAYWKIRARLLRVPGVANVAIWGERIDMLTRCRSSPRSSRTHGVTLDAGDGRHRRRPRLGAAAVHQQLLHRQGRFHRDPQPAPQRAPRAAHRHPGRPRRGGRQRQGRRRACAWRRGGRRAGPPAAGR